MADPYLVIGDWDYSFCLETTRYVLRNLACRINGETYYLPLVKADDANSDAIKIRCRGQDYALPKGGFYYPITHDAKNRIYPWAVSGNPTTSTDYPEFALFNGSSYIYRPEPYTLAASDIFTFETRVIPTTVNSTAHAIFELYKSSTARVTLALGGANKFVVGFNNASSAIITSPTTVTKDDSYLLKLQYMGGRFTLYVDGVEVGSASKSITAGDYTPYIGYSKAKSHYFYGYIRQPKLTGAAEFFFPFAYN